MTVQPSGWKQVPLHEVCENIQYGYTAKAVDEPVGPKFLRITDIVPELIDWQTVPHCEIPAAKADKYVLRDGDIVVARTGATTGYAKLLKNPPEAVFASYLVRLQIDPDTDARYVGAVVQSDQYKRFIMQHVGGAAQPNANARILTSFPLPLPPLETQRQIADILSAYDDLIENNSRRIQILEEMARTIYREWFVHFRYPGHESVPLVDFPIGPVPEGWEIRKVDSFGEVITGKTPSKSQPKNFGDYMPFIKIPDMRGNLFVLKTEESLSKVGSESQRTKTLPPGSVCTSCIGTIGLVSIVDRASQTNQQINSIILQEKHDREFLYFALRELGTLMALHGATGATMGNLSKGKFSALNVVYPPHALVSRFSELTDSMLAHVRSLMLKNSNLGEARDLLLPRLISGTINISSVHDLESVVAR